MVSKASRLAELRALRASGKTRLASYEVKEAEDIYDEHDETSYNKLIRARLDQDDFVINDNGEGYADDGREEWIGERTYNSGSESEPGLPLKGKAGKARSSTQSIIILTVWQQKESAKKRRREQKEQLIASTSTSTMGTLPRRPNPKYVESCRSSWHGLTLLAARYDCGGCCVYGKLTRRSRYKPTISATLTLKDCEECYSPKSSCSIPTSRRE